MDTSKPLPQYTVEELQAKLTEEKAHLQKLRAAHAIEPLKDPMRIRKAKRNIARITTFFHQKNAQKPQE